VCAQALSFAHTVRAIANAEINLGIPFSPIYTTDAWF